MNIKTIYKFLFPIVIIVAIAALLTLTLGRDDYVVKIGNIKVGSSEFYVYLYEQKQRFEQRGDVDIWEMDFDGESSENVAKQNALNSLTYVKMAQSYAKKGKLNLTVDEYNQAQDYAVQIYESMLANSDESRLRELNVTQIRINKISEEIQIYKKVHEDITRNYVLSEADFETFFQEFYVKNLSSILTNSTVLKERIKEYYIELKKDEIFKQEYDKWAANIEIIKNPLTWRQISVNDY